MNKKISGTYMKRNSETGQALAIAAIGLTVLMLAAGLSIDMGYLRYQRRRMQTAADSAAIAAATQLGGAYSDAAIADATLNGFNPSNNVTITTTPVTCPGPAASPNCVQVQVSQPQTTFFMKILGTNLSPTVSAVATAEQVPGLGCMYALSNASDAVEVGYSYHTMVVGPNCGIFDNGGLDVEIGAGSHTVYGESIGDASYNGGGTVSPTPVTLPVPVGDPFASLSAPPGGVGTCGTELKSYDPTKTNYPCGLTIDTGPSGTTTTLSPGLYTIGGTGLNISGSGGVLSGTGVTFYIANNVPGTNAAVNINNGYDGPPTTSTFGATVQLQAPIDATSPGIPGVVLFQDSSDTAPANVTLAGFKSSDTVDLDSYLWGAVYVPGATLTLVGTGYDDTSDYNGDIDKCSSVPRLTTVVAYKLVFHENLNFSTDDCVWPPVPVDTKVPSPNRNAVLVK